MNTLYIPIGISGSGKTTYGNKLNAVVVCPDDIRKELTGDISDQSKNAEVFSLYKKKLSELAHKGKDAYASMTHLRYSYIKDTINSYDSPKPFRVKFLLFDDSLDWEKCYERVKNDLKNKIDRSNVPEHIIKTQSERYKMVRDVVIKKSNPDFYNNVASIEIETIH